MFNDPKAYWYSPYNWNDLFQYLGTVFIIVINLFWKSGIALEQERNICAFVLISQGAKMVLDWLRLFDNTSFYVTLIIKTIRDIGYIAVIIVIILVYIGSAMYMLQLNSDQSVEEAAIIRPIFDSFLVDSMVNQYLLMLGEFNLDGFSMHMNTAVCYALFIFTTFITQITFLNMLIAIMGDTFDKVIDQRPTYSLKNKLMLMADMQSFITTTGKTNQEDNSKVFLYVIQPAHKNEDEVVDEEGQWRGKVWYIQNLIKSKFDKSNEQVQQIAVDLRRNIDKSINNVKTQQGQLNAKLAEKIDSIAQNSSSHEKQKEEEKPAETKQQSVQIDHLKNKMDK